MVTESVVIENAPCLISLIYHNAKAFAFDGCPNLRELECDSYRQTSIDLGPLANLQRLRCRCSALSQLDLRYLPKLQELDVTACASLKKIKVGNGSILDKLTLIRAALDVHSGRWLRKTVADNGGVIIDKD